jgi:hypothetical protein
LPILGYDDIQPITQEEAVQEKLNDLDSEGFTATSWQEGSQALLMVNLVGELQSNLADVAVYLRDAYIPSSPNCVGPTLKAASSGFYNNPFNPAIPAQHLVTLTCSATQGPYTINRSDLVCSYVSPDAALQLTFRNIDGNSIVYPFVLASGSSATFLFEAETAGAQANVGNNPTNTAPSPVFTLTTTLAGVSIAAHSIYRSGLDEESDERLLERDQLKWSTLSDVELIDDRVKYWALQSAPAITTIAVDSTNPRGAGTFDVYVAELDSTANPTDVALVQTALDLRTFGRSNTPKTCKVYAAPEVALNITGALYFAGIDQTVAIQAATDALLAFVRAAPCGGYSYAPYFSHTIRLEDLTAIMRDAALEAGATKATVVLTNPTSDVAVAQFGKVIRGSWAITPVLLNA